MKILINAILLAAFTLISACGQTKTPPFEVSLGETGGQPAIFLEAIVDKVKLESFQINRGNCYNSGPRSIDFVFGGKTMFSTFGCNVKELSVNTDHGNFTYSF